MISTHWSFTRDSDVPKPEAGEIVMTKAWVERGLSLPCSEFFLSVLNTYGLQPHNICPNSYLLLSNFVTLCEGHLGIRPDVKLWQFFFRVKKETKDKAMVNCGSMTFMLRPSRMYPPHDSHESVRYWNAGWFYEKNASVPDIHEGLPKFINEPPEELASWSFVPSLAQTPILEKEARRISWLVHDGLTGAQLTLSWFSRRIQPLRHNARLMCAYTGADDLLRVTRHDLPADSLKRRFKTLVKIPRGQQVPELIKDIYTNDQCPPLNTLAEENFCTILRVPVSGDAAEEVPEDDEEEEEQHPARRPLDLRSVPAPKLPALKPELAARPPPRSPRPNPSTTATRTIGQEPITKYMKKSPAVGPTTPVPPSTSHPTPRPSPPQADPSPPPAANTPPEIIPAYATKFFNKLSEAEKWELEQDLLNAMLNNAWGKPDSATSEIQDFKKNVGQFLDKLICKQKVLPRASSSLATASSELENLRSSYQELETKLKEAELKKEQAEKQLAEKNSEHIREKGELILKKNADSETIKRQQKELNGLRKYMETAEHHWDLLNENILEPLGYPEQRRNLFPRDDLLQLAGDDCKDLISASRKICYNLSIKRSRTCNVRKLVGKMDVLPELVTDLQASSARGAMTLTMCLAHNPDLDLDQVTTGVPPNADVNALLDAVSGYDTRTRVGSGMRNSTTRSFFPVTSPGSRTSKELDAKARPHELNP
ncbi:hypothetical protein QYE76_061432 [Lolium multiflorum]|uniref:Transposase (putative) gypsy type domain-containing protein n=1 Tax=Lolium multiflorum TaxID=4521 RepID=A0AAD8S187_LOLMU|nr:hypothetical protein QYE76_061432 [Lolium multiflorum]